jgi:hypothetical protein
MATADLSKQEVRQSILQNIHNMERELTAQVARVAELERALQTSEDRVYILSQDRQKYLQEAKLYRGKLIELATSMANIGLLTRDAEQIMMTVKELEAGETKEQADEERRSAAEAVANLPPRTVDDVADRVEGLLKDGAVAGVQPPNNLLAQ